jgi:hypothetical protein
MKLTYLLSILLMTAVLIGFVNAEPVYNGSIQLNGTQYGIINDTDEMPNYNFTMSVWIYPTNISSGEQVIFSTEDDGNFELSINESGEFILTMGDGSNISSTSDVYLTENQWHAVVLRRGTPTTDIWIDSVQHTFDTVPTASINQSPIYVGIRADGTGGFIGRMDEMVFFGQYISSGLVIGGFLWNGGAGMYGTLTQDPYIDIYFPWMAWHFDEWAGNTTADFGVNVTHSIQFYNNPIWRYGKIEAPLEVCSSDIQNYTIS